MCHIIFVIPFASLLLFYYLPFKEALAWFVAINAVCFFIFYKIYQVMKRKHESGKSAMIGKEATVIEEVPRGWRVLIDNELWYASSDAALNPGQKCIVVDFEGLTARVRPKVWAGGVLEPPYNAATQTPMHK